MMRAGVFVKGQADVVSLVDAEVPSLAEQVPGTCLVRGLFASLCGTDMLMIEKPRAIDWLGA